MIRPPSLVRSWDAFYPKDPAFKQAPALPADDAPQADRDEFKLQAEAYLTTLRTCRETGDWSPLRIEDREPTKFVMGPVDRNIWRELLDRCQLSTSSPRSIGFTTLLALLFRLSVRQIVGWEKIVREPDPDWGDWTMAPADLVDQLDNIDSGIVGELGREVLEKLKATRPF
jgi:hypothetical protein